MRLVLALLLVAALMTAAPVVSNAQSKAPTKDVAQFNVGDPEFNQGFDDNFDDYDDGPVISDPFIVWNKIWFHYNDALYRGVFKPVARGYSYVVPERPRGWVSNFFTNLAAPIRFVNDILQGKFDAAYMEFSKFIANTAFGLGGLADVTEGRKRNWEPERPTADGFGQTLGKAGMGHGIYLVWPFIGPSSVRESFGWVGDQLLHPVTYTDFSLLEKVGIHAYQNINELAGELDGTEYDTITEGAIDPYAAVRDAYIRYRNKKVLE